MIKETSTSGSAGGYLSKNFLNKKFRIKEIKINNPQKPFEIGEKVIFIDSPNGNKEFEVKRYSPDGRIYISSKSGGYETWVKRSDLKSVNESKYTQFKKKTIQRNPKEQVHQAVKEIHMRLDEVNKLIDHTERMKMELKEGDDSFEYLKRTTNSLTKIQEKIGIMNEKLKNIIK